MVGVAGGKFFNFIAVFLSGQGFGLSQAVVVYGMSKLFITSRSYQLRFRRLGGLPKYESSW